MSAIERVPAVSVPYRFLLVSGLTAMIMFGIVATSAKAQTNADDDAAVTTISISGTATANGEKIPPGASIVVFTTDSEGNEFPCGRFTTESGGRFTLSLNIDCRDATELNYRIEGMSAQTRTAGEIRDGVADLSVGFSGLSDEELTRLGLVSSGADIQQVPLISEDSLKTILILTVIIGAGVLVVLIFMSATSAKSERSFQMPTEALILLTVIVAVIILGVTGKIGSDGLISVLAAIVGWTAARASGRSSQPPEPPVINIGSELPLAVAEQGASTAAAGGAQDLTAPVGDTGELSNAEPEAESSSAEEAPVEEAAVVEAEVEEAAEGAVVAEAEE